MEIKERISAILSYYNLSVNEFVERTGIKTKQAVYDLLHGKTRSISTSMESKILSCFPDISRAWLLTGEGEMRLTPSPPMEPPPNPLSTDTRPRLPLNVTAGLNEILNGVALAQCEQVPVVPMLPNYSFTMRVAGESMMPYINPGDELACLKIDEPSFLQWGRIYVMFTSQGVMVKKIFDAGDGIRCVSFNADYPDFIVPKSEIYSFNLVIGLVRICN